MNLIPVKDKCSVPVVSESITMCSRNSLIAFVSILGYFRIELTTKGLGTRFNPM